MKLRFLIVSSAFLDWFIPLLLLPPYRGRKAKICEDQALETKLQVTFDQGNLYSLRTQQHVKGCKKFK